MNKKGLKKYLYALCQMHSLTKTFNFYCILGASIVIFILGIADNVMTNIGVTTQEKKTLILFFVIIIFFLLIARILWKKYSQSKLAGLVEVIAVYADLIMLIELFGDAFGLSVNVIICCIVIMLICFICWSLITVWYESNEIPSKDRKLLKNIFLGIWIIALLLIGVFIITEKIVFGVLAFVIIGCQNGGYFFCYVLILKFPFKSRLEKEFGPKDIEASSIFINKKKNEEK